MQTPAWPWTWGAESRHIHAWRDAGSPTATSYPTGLVPNFCRLLVHAHGKHKYWWCIFKYRCHKGNDRQKPSDWKNPDVLRLIDKNAASPCISSLCPMKKNQLKPGIWYEKFPSQTSRILSSWKQPGTCNKKKALSNLSHNKHLYMHRLHIDTDWL